MNLHHIRRIIDDVIVKMDMYYPEASDMVFYTGAYESKYEKIFQDNNGPARSFWQEEPPTVLDHFNNYLLFPENRSKLLKIKGACGLVIHPDYFTESEISWLLTTNLAFAIAMCRIDYYRTSYRMPSDPYEMAYIYKTEYNSKKGKGDIDEFVETYHIFKKKLE